MITITRRLALQLRTVMRRAFGNFRGTGPAIGFIACKEGLIARSVYGDAAVEYRVPGEREPETIWLPFEFLADVEGKKDDPVELEVAGKQIHLQWSAGNVPKSVKYDAKEPADKFPVLPVTFTTNRPGLLQALHEASEVTDSSAARYATHCVQLAADGTINATDGRQLLIQAGFTFPWKADVLMPRNKVFASPELPQDQPACIAQSGGWVVVSAGAWTIYLRAGVGSFPKLSKVVPDVTEAKARCQLSKDDIRFLAETLPQLPGNEVDNRPVTIDVNGHVAVRARADDQTTPTEVVLTNSRSTGEPVRINTNREYLATALRLGLSDLCFYGEASALLCQGFERKFVWMPLDGDAAIKPTDDVVRIESPQGELAAPISQSENPRSGSPVSDTTPNTTTKPATSADTPKKRVSRRKANQQDLAVLIDQAVQFRSALHTLVQQSNGLVKALKQHKRQNKAIQSTLASLKQLQSLGV